LNIPNYFIKFKITKKNIDFFRVVSKSTKKSKTYLNMDRQLHPKYFPDCPRHASLVDQYMWPEKDTNNYTCHNGVSHPIYNCKGWINYSLPLEMYPPENNIHPQIEMIRRTHLNTRIPSHRVAIMKEGYEPEGTGMNTTGFLRGGRDGTTYGYTGPVPRQGWFLATGMVPGYSLPDQSGDAASCSACTRGLY